MLELGFRNKENQIRYVEIEVYNTVLANIWKKHLTHLLSTHKEKIFQKNFSLLGFHNDDRTRDHICNDLERSISVINRNGDYKINEDFTSLRSSYNQELLNVLHHHFEVTQGQLWNPGSVLAKANGETRLAICLLNHCCHELEAWYDTSEKQRPNTNGYFYYNLLGITDRIEIPIEEKKNFTRKMSDGMVYLHYAQTGKTWYEAYLDGDDVVGTDGISEHRIITGEFNCYLGPGYELPMDKSFTQWLEAKGIDPTNEQLALGFAPVGKIKNLDHKTAPIFFEEYTDFYSITFNDLTVLYDYRHNDTKYYNMLVNMWNKWEDNG